MMERVSFTVSDASNLGKEKHLRPTGDEAKAVLDKLTVSETVAVEIYRPRNNKLSSRVQLVFERIGKAKGMRVRNVRGWIAAMTGRADVVELSPGTPVMIAWGTGARDMNAAQFEAFWDDAKTVIIEDILPRLEPDDAAEIRNMVI